MRRFKVLPWLRKVREENYRQDRGLTPEQVIDRTRAEARAFRASRAKGKTALKRE